MIEMVNYQQEEIKHTTIALQKLSYRKAIEDYRGQIDYEEAATEYAICGLLDGIRKFIKTEVVERGPERHVTATIGLHYVYDNAVASLKNDSEFWHNSYAHEFKRRAHLQARVDYLELPWHKKIYLWATK